MASFHATTIGRGRLLKTPSAAPVVNQVVAVIAANEIGFVNLLDAINAVSFPTTNPEVAGRLWNNQGLLTVSDGPAGVGGWRVGQTFVVS